MKRRDFVKAMAAASVAVKTAFAQQTAVMPAAPAAPVLPPHAPIPPGPVPWSEGLLDVNPLPISTLVADTVAQSGAHFFSARQMSTLRRLCEILMPPYKDHPGATEAGAPEFLDFLVSVSPAQRQQIWAAGLDRLEAEASERFHVAFASVNAAQADALIRPWLRTWMQDHPPREGFAQFINLAHTDIRAATINSQAWNDAEEAAGRPAPQRDLYWYPVDPDMRRHTQEPPRRERATPSRA